MLKKFTGFMNTSQNKATEFGNQQNNKGIRGKQRLITNSTISKTIFSSVDYQGIFSYEYSLAFLMGK